MCLNATCHPDRWWKVPYYWAGSKLYDLLAGSQSLESSYYLSRSKALEVFPMLKSDHLCGAMVYYDGAFLFPVHVLVKGVFCILFHDGELPNCNSNSQLLTL